MDLSAAQERIRKALNAMQACYRQPVFDEWAIVSIREGDFEVISYQGERDKKNLIRDVSSIYTQLTSKAHYPGEFDFTFDGHEELFDAYMAIGDCLFVLFNNTETSTAHITASPLWKKAQGEFVDLGDAFAADPVTAASR